MQPSHPQAITVVIPAFNEQSALGDVLTDLRTNCPDLAVIVVDDGSTDDTAGIARQHGVTVISHPTNQGYGAALKSGIRHAQTPYVLLMDADGQHDAAAARVVAERAGNADMIVGVRPALVHGPMWRMPGKWLLRAMASYLTRRQIPDLNSGLRLFRREVLMKYLHLCPNGFSFTTTTTLALMSRGWSVAYVPFSIRPRRGSSTVSVTTGLETIVLILRIIALFHPLRVFVPAAAVIAAAGAAWGVPIALAGRGISVGSMLAIVTAVILFALGLLCDQISQLRLERFE